MRPSSGIRLVGSVVDATLNMSSIQRRRCIPVAFPEPSSPVCVAGPCRTTLCAVDGGPSSRFSPPTYRRHFGGVVVVPLQLRASTSRGRRPRPIRESVSWQRHLVTEDRVEGMRRRRNSNTFEPGKHQAMGKTGRLPSRAFRGKPCCLFVGSRKRRATSLVRNRF